jgi:hypothetical protein
MTNRFCLSCFIMLLFFLLPVQTARASQDAEARLYPGILLSQHQLAQTSMHEFFNHHWQKAESLCLCMRRLEQDSASLPLSFLLRFAMRSWRVLNNEYDNPEQAKILIQELDPLRDECIRILHNQRFPDSTRAMRLFLEGGINGFNSTLKIRSHPYVAMVSGLSSVRLLDTARAIAPYLKDVYLGLGIAQCALANEPGIIRVAMRLFHGLRVNLDTGLTYLRICSQSAQYTQVGAMEYLIQFLSPFKQAERDEKQQMFRSLESAFPDNPYYVFQEIDEDLAFHRENTFSKNLVEWAKTKLRTFDTCNVSLRLYANLVRWQCAAIDPSQKAVLRPTQFTEREAFSFYPVFLAAARMHYEIDLQKDLPANQRKKAIHDYHRQRDLTVRILRSSDIDPMLREYYLWHIEDGLQ